MKKKHLRYVGKWYVSLLHENNIFMHIYIYILFIRTLNMYNLYRKKVSTKSKVLLAVSTLNAYLLSLNIQSRASVFFLAIITHQNKVCSMFGIQLHATWPLSVFSPLNTPMELSQHFEQKLSTKLSIIKGCIGVADLKIFKYTNEMDKIIDNISNIDLYRLLRF